MRTAAEVAARLPNPTLEWWEGDLPMQLSPCTGTLQVPQMSP